MFSAIVALAAIAARMNALGYCVAHIPVFSAPDCAIMILAILGFSIFEFTINFGSGGVIASSKVELRQSVSSTLMYVSKDVSSLPTASVLPSARNLASLTRKQTCAAYIF